MSVWFCIPSARPPAEANKILQVWRDRGYKIALMVDDGANDHETMAKVCDLMIVADPYPGYARAVNHLAKTVFEHDPTCNWIVTGGDDTLPDPNVAPEEIVRQCEEHFSKNYYRTDPLHDALEGLSLDRCATFGVMQPTGDRWNDGSIDRIAGSPWLGREFCQRMYGGTGPYHEGYDHMFVDEEVQHVAMKLGVFWQRRDLTHLHYHFCRTPDGLVSWDNPIPEHLKKWNGPEHWNESKALFLTRLAAGFPGHEAAKL